MSLLHVKIHDIKIGHRLGEDIFSGKGILLAKKNQVIDDRVLQILRSFGLAQISVLESKSEQITELENEGKKEIQVKVQKRFKNLNLKSPVVEKIYQFCIQKRENLSPRPREGESTRSL